MSELITVRIEIHPETFSPEAAAISRAIRSLTTAEPAFFVMYQRVAADADLEAIRAALVMRYGYRLKAIRRVPEPDSPDLLSMLDGQLKNSFAT